MKTKEIKLLKSFDKPPAVILGDYPITILGVIKSLCQKNIPLLVVSHKKSEAFFSRFAHGFISPNVLNNEEEYIDYLCEIGRHLSQKGVLMPTTDVEILPILRNRKRLEDFFYFPLPEFDIVDNLLNKKKIYKILKDLDIDHPKTFFLENEDDIKRVTEIIDYPCIIKPTYHDKFYGEFLTKILIAKSRRDLISLFKKTKDKGFEVVIQEYIPGNDDHLYEFASFYDKTFSQKASFVFQRLRGYPIITGNCTFTEYVSNDELEKIIATIVKKYNFYGILEAEFIKDPRDNNFKLIELNPRLWKTVSFPTSFGINIPYMSYQNALGKEIENPTFIRENVNWLDFRADIMSSFQNMRRGNLTVDKWIKSYFGKKEHASFSWNDPLPAFVLYTHTFFTFIPYLLKCRTSFRETNDL